MNTLPPLFATLITAPLLYAGTLSSVVSSPSLVVYNANLGLVHESRAVALDKGEQTIVCSDVAGSIIAESVNLTLPKGVTLYSQQFRYNQINVNSLAQANLGKTVTFYIPTGSELMYKSGTLLSASSQALVKTADEKIYTVPVTALVFHETPENPVSKPSLVWNIIAPKKENTSLSLDYLINNISWRGDYALTLSQDYADLNGWITVDNRSGKAFNDTKLSLLAGNIDRAAVPRERHYMAKAAFAENDAAAVQKLSFEGYHLYPIPFKVSLASNESTQIKFMEIVHIPVTRSYKTRLNDPHHLQGEVNHQVGQYLVIKSLDQPLPMGTIRSYSKVKGQTLLLGESMISHTPKHQPIEVTLGKAIDLQVKERMLDDNSDRYYFDTTVSYEVTNRSSRAERIELLVPYIKRKNGQMSVDTSQQYRWKNGSMLAFDVQVSADGKKVFDVHFRRKK